MYTMHHLWNSPDTSSYIVVSRVAHKVESWAQRVYGCHLQHCENENVYVLVMDQLCIACNHNTVLMKVLQVLMPVCRVQLCAGHYVFVQCVEWGGIKSVRCM